MTITPNPGFAMLFAAALLLILPRALRGPTMALGAIGAVYLMFEHEFGLGPGFAQIGLAITPLRLDPLSQVFGLGFGLITIVFALYANQRVNKIEDVALMAHAGGATTAVFAGDLVSFVAAAQFSALAGAVLVFAGGKADSRGAGVRFLCWHALSGILMAAGVGLAWVSTGHVNFERLQAQSLDGALLFAGAMVAAGAPFAHVWLKDGLPQTSALGGAAFGAFTLKLGLYALARAFPGEPLLLYLGAIMALGALPLAALAGDVRQSAAYGLISQSGAAMAALGAGTPLALAAGAAMSFTSLLTGALALLAIGTACERAGSAREDQLGGLARTMPLTALLAIVAALSTMAAPGFAGFTGSAIVMDAIALEDRPMLWLAIVASAAGAALHIGARIPYAVFFGADRGKRPEEAPFGALLAMGLAAFFVIAIGVAPGWLYGFLPEKAGFYPYNWDRLIRHGELAAVALLAFGGARFLKFYPTKAGAELMDVDWLLRQPGRRILRWIGAQALRAYEGGRVAVERLYSICARAVSTLAAEGDRPAAPDAAGLVWALVVLAVTMAFLFAFQR